jgi:MoxR-like ATPase
MGASPRASIALMRASRVLAAADGRIHVFPDDVRHLLLPVMAHRLILTPDSVLRGETVEALLERIAAKTRAPMMSHTTQVPATTTTGGAAAAETAAIA